MISRRQLSTVRGMADPAIGWAGAPRALFGQLPELWRAFLVALMIACLLVPLPQGLVDILLSGSLAFSLLLFVAALGSRDPVRFSVFPQLLLLVTSFRLVLNTATTRLILGEGDAGRVIDAFAGFVTRGDLVVGLVMFGIVTAIQYLVIARGTERVAEVGARFALDGMPGRQAAIEADLRAGFISPAEAARRRAELDARSELHGNMDGAAKFVRQDALVGLLIVGINLVGGIGIGVVRQGMGIGEALDLYGRLAVGDGLLSQIPAVLVSLAAGVLVARVDDRRLGARQSWFEPAMLVVPAALLLGVAFVPGMPSLAFSLVGGGLLVAAVAMTARRPAQTSRGREGLQLRVPAGKAEDPALAAELRVVMAQASENLGLDLPPLEIEGHEAAALELRLGDRLLMREPMTAGGTVALQLFRAVTRAGEHFVDLERIEAWLEAERRVRPASVRGALAHLSAREILALVRGLLRDRIPLPHPRELIAAVAEDARFGEQGERERWPELLRTALASTWVHDLVDAHRGQAKASFVRATPDLELAFEAHARKEDGRWRPKLSLARRQAVGSQMLEGRERAIVVTRASVRAAAAAFFEGQSPRVPVLSREELERAGLSVDGAAAVDEAAFDAAGV